MRNWWVVVALLVVQVALVAPASAKRASCQAPVGRPAPHQSMDREPPAAPVVERTVLYPDGISIGATFSPDTVAVQILYTDSTGATAELWTPPTRLYVCSPPAAHLTEVSITAIDEAGNTSTTLGQIERAYDGSGRRHRCGLGPTMLYLFAIPVVALAAFGFFVLFRGGYRRYKMRRGGEPLTPLVAEAITRATIDHKLFVIAATMLLAAALYFTDDEGYAALVAYVPISRIIHLVIARRFLAHIESLVLPVTLHDNLLVVHPDRYIVVPRSIAREAKRRAVPAAIQR